MSLSATAKLETSSTLGDTPHEDTRLNPRRRSSLRRMGHISLLLAGTLLAFLLLGYHPYAEDGGIYAAAVEARADPVLFPHDRVWVTAHTRFALFVPLVGRLTRMSHLSVATALLALQIMGLLALLSAAAHLARTCLPSCQRPWLAPLALALLAGVPVAGTALYAVDPYCTARTITSPLLLFALSLALRRSWIASAACWAAAATMHPLMALWGSLPLLLTGAYATRQPRRWVFAFAITLFVAALLLTRYSPAETVLTRAAALTREYWFPARWRWFEWLGAAAPCLLLPALRSERHDGPAPAYQRLVHVAIATTGVVLLLAVCFARASAVSLALARLQPLRGLHLIFLAFVSAGGAAMQPMLRIRRNRYWFTGACVIAVSSVFLMQRSLYPDARSFELPWSPPDGPWLQAFTWCRDHTPQDALFALDPGYINAPGENSQGFRAIALRSTLPDGVKDAGIAAVLPALAPQWQVAVNATRDLNHIPDRERLARLTPLGVTWVVLSASATTRLSCPFHNRAVQVCPLQ